MASSPAANATPDARLIPVDAIMVVSNTRKRFPPLDDLKASIEQHGILQPLRVQQREDGKFRLIFGECRLKAAKLAKLTAVPAIVVTATDEQILEEQLVENAQRKDIHPMEEAEGYGELRTKHSKTIEELALRAGKSKGHVLMRLKLLDLAPAVRAAFYDDKLSIRAAYALARIPGQELQLLAFEELKKPRYGAGWTDAEVERFIRERFMLALDKAPFDRKDGALVPEAGACGPCPKRTGNARDLFGDVKEKEVCTDPSCFEAKTRATWTQKCEEALARGWEVLDEEESRKLFPYGGNLEHNAPFIELDARNYQDPKQRTWRQLLSKTNVQVILAKDSFNKTHHLVKKDEAKTAAAERGFTFAAKVERGDDQYRAHMKQQREKTAERASIARAAIAKVVEASTKKAADAAFWRLILSGLANGSWHDVIQSTVKRRGWDEKGKRPEELLLTRIEKLPADELRGLAVELIVGRGAFWSHATDFGENLKTACALYGINLGDVAKEVRAAEKTASPAATKKKAA